uniref:Uncharacterized protein n=1 Tax=Anguilla anguilla TaxID=7936 RepID=A0A0E9UKI1_ANGAN
MHCGLSLQLQEILANSISGQSHCTLLPVLANH